MDAGQSQNFTASASGGTPSYSYQWYLDGSSVGGATSSTWTYTSSSSGAHTVYCAIEDSATTPYNTESNTAPISVNSALSISISPTSATLDVPQSQLFNSSILGGTSPYSYQWYLNSAPVSGATNPTWTFTPASAGSYTVYLNVTDAANAMATSSTATVKVNGQLSASILPSSATLDAGQSQNFTSTVSGGTGPYSYQWYLNGSLVNGATGASWTFTQLSAGTYQVYLIITDSLSMQATSATSTVTVNPLPTVTISPSSAVIDWGQSVLFTSSVTGGTSPYSYQWYLDGAPVYNATGASWLTPLSTGIYEVYVVVTDSLSMQNTSATSTVTVNPLPSVTINPAYATIDFGQPETFTSNPANGTSPYSYQWYLNGAPVSGATNQTWTFTPNSTGPYQIYLVITDNVSSGATSNTANLNVNQAPTVSITPTSALIDADQSQLFNSTVLGGTSPFTYQWYLDGSPVSDATSATWTFSPSSSGSYTVYLTVTDNVGISVSSSNSTLNANPELTAAISPTSAAIILGQSQNFTCSASGGTSPFTYQWYLNGTSVSGATNPTWTFTPTIAGSYTVYVNVTDSLGAQAASGSATATVNSNLIHEVTVTNVTSSKTIVCQGYGLNITVTAGNPGDYTETFNITLYANATAIGNITITNLPNGTHTSIVYVWNTTGFAYGNYTISASASPVPGQTNTANINCTGGCVFVSLIGDLTGPNGVPDGKVDIRDVHYVAIYYGTTPSSPNWNPNADINNDGKVDIKDVHIVAEHYGQSVTY
jgi:hypothetical protein